MTMKSISIEEKEQGVRITVWIPTDLAEIIEDTRRKLGLSKSGFYRYAMLHLLESMNVLSKKVNAGGEGT